MLENKNFVLIKPQTRGVMNVLRYCVLILTDIFYKLLFKLFPLKNQINKKKYYLSICSIFKNEGLFLKEWLDYNLIMGFEHFYLYNNNSDDNFREILKPYIEQGIVTLVEWPQVPGQLAMYEHWYKTYRHETQWVSFLDLDEFFCPKQERSVPEWLKKFEKYPLIMVYWKMFGTSGLMKHDENKTCIEQYTNSWGKLANLGKLIYNTDYEIAFFKLDMMHYFMVKYKGLKIPPINQFGHFVIWNNINRTNGKPADIQLNHYWSKAYDNYISKHKRGSAVFGKSWKTFDKFMDHEYMNISSDYSIYRFLVLLKLKMSGNLDKEEKENS